MSIIVRARFVARHRAEFEQLILALTARAADEEGTLTYRWFGPLPDGYVVIEEYADTAAALAHNERSADLLARVATAADLASAELYGPIGPELAAWAAARPQVTVVPEFPGPA